MKALTLVMALVCIGLVACSSSPYRPANGSGVGYQDNQLSDTRWRVRFVLSGDERNKAMDYAYLRAAELTLQKGFDWFEVVDRASAQRGGRTGGSSVSASRTYASSERHCGLLACRDYPTTSTSVGMSVGEERQKTEASLELLFGKGVRPEDGNFYDAQTIVDTLRDALIEQ